MKKSISISYNSSQGAPTIEQKVSGAAAEQLNQAAQEAGILLHQDEHLMSLLESLEQGEEIPESLYVLMAELISFSYLLQGKFPEHWHKDGNPIELEI
ncbi:EscU/YscU/HrcU family type III secretion system export apparatus switch protein [Motilimonas eburnea]|uniref:EscU/YscU/HrcU family type III secretion system export apparatus switch protein n=1 Tax=Motilimonas eburnea TaxID=1737488 RepID=UPI001E6228E5|nr:EscU/YscU/HrcU family type III secretion system export apparatus switch protein [Motilimonas eburnea]